MRINTDLKDLKKGLTIDLPKPTPPQAQTVELLEESHYQRLSYLGRSNIYSLTIPELSNTTKNKNKPLRRSILVALTDGVYILHQTQDTWFQIKEPVDPGDLFCSLDAYYLSFNVEEPFFICYGKTLNKGGYSINFAKLKVGKNEEANSIEVMDRFHLPFEGAPLKITHTSPIDGSDSVITFIVCSSKNTVHTFQLKKGKRLLFEEKDITVVYPELEFLTKLNSNILALVIETEDNIRRIVVGCQDGQLLVKVVEFNSDTKSFTTTIESEAQLMFPITSVVIFDNSKVFNKRQGLALLVTCSVNLAFIYKSMYLDEPKSLPIPNSNDSILSATLADLDLDFKLEIVLGTFHHQLLTFKPNEDDDLNLVYSRKLPYSIYGILDCDFDGDGLKELVVMTTFGLHVLKPKLANARDKILNILERLTKLNIK